MLISLATCRPNTPMSLSLWYVLIATRWLLVRHVAEMTVDRLPSPSNLSTLKLEMALCGGRVARRQSDAEIQACSRCLPAGCMLL